MSAAPLITYLRLDPEYDPIFTVEDSLTDGEAVAQAILTRLKLFQGEWWENQKLGLPVIQSMLGQLASTSNLRAVQALIQQNIQGAPYVTAVQKVSANLVNGRLTISVQAATMFGSVTVTS